MIKHYDLKETMIDAKVIQHFLVLCTTEKKRLTYTEKLHLPDLTISVAYCGRYKYYIHDKADLGVVKICVYEETK